MVNHVIMTAPDEFDTFLMIITPAIVRSSGANVAARKISLSGSCSS